MNDQYKLKLGLRWWENQTEDPRREGRGPHLSDEWRWKAMQASIAAYGPTAEALQAIGERPDITVQEEKEIAEQVAKAMEEARCDAGSFGIERLIGAALVFVAAVVYVVAFITILCTC